MAKREWMVLGAIFTAVTVAVLLEPEHGATSGHTHGVVSAPDTPPGLRTVTLAVSGMT